MRPFLAVVLLLWSTAATAAIPAAEREALVAFYQSTNGAAWTDHSNWLGATGTECTWHGVECEETQSNVIGLNLDSNHLDGTLPSSIRNLTKARFLIFAGNDLRGPIPPEIGELTDLQAIYLQANHFTGNIPTSFASLKKLTYLGAYGNELSGKLPAHVAGMPALEELYLSENQFDGTIPSELAQLTNLKVLELNSNRLTGNIPIALTTMTKLDRLTLNDNQLTGPIPPQLGNLTALVTLRLGYNRLEGPFPAALGQLAALEELYLPVNELVGPIPDAVGDLAALKRLDLRENQFDQTLPAGLYRMANLEELLLSGNEFTGTVSPQIANLAKLQVFSLYDNHFNGSIPPELGNIAPLRSIELLSNDFTGTIPADLSRLTNLTWLDVADNQLTGTIPPELGLLPNLEVLSMYGNSLEGTIPRQLGQLSKLRILLLAANRLHGGIPDELRNLTKLEQFNVNENRLSGAIPSWIGEWTALTDLYLSFNEFSGPLPPGLSTLENLVALDLAVNEFTGRFVDFTRMPHVAYITASFNHFSGPLPPSIGSLTNLSYMAMAANDFSGTIPPEIGGLVNVGYFDLAGNELEGAIPKEIGNLKKAYNISLDGNHLSGTIPKELGQLTDLLTLGLSFNALKGPIPPEITAMTGLQDHGSHFAYNGLFANDANTRAFVNLKHEDGDFEATQTVMPTNVRLAETTDRSATLVWDPIRYEYYGGGYQVAASTTPNGPTVALATTSSKSLDRITVRNLQPATTYYFTVATVSHPISGQPNLITSDRTAPVQGSTKQRVIAPADVVMTDPPNGMVQIDGQEVQGDSFTLTNFGDVATAITLERTETFFTIAPEQFSLAAGASQVVTLHSLTQQPGTYDGYVTIDGQGVPEDLYAQILLLSSARPAGSVVATPLATRIELAGAAGSDEVGTAQFRNTGTARLTGIVVSDQPWVEVEPEPITIDPGQIGEVNFRIVRSKRPPSEGALTAELSLVYVNGGNDARGIGTQGATTSTAISISKVTIVDVTQPSLVTGKLPPLLPGEVPFFIPGLTASASQRTDLTLINGGGPSLISDLKLYFTGGSQTSIASLQPLGFAQSVNLVNIVGSVYGTTGSGTLQVRSANADGISAGAKVTSVSDAGTYTGSIPVFRGDRSASPGQKIYLAGIQPGGDLIVQETGGNAGSVEISCLNATGGLFSTRTESIGAYGVLELGNAVPANAVTAIITGTGAVITAYARQHDVNGDTWSVVDWSRFYGYARTDTVRVPFADGRGGVPRRRAARHDAPAGVATNATARRTTDLVLFNPTSSDVRATLQVIDTSGRVQERTVNVPALATVNVSDAASTAGSSVAHVVIVPGRSELVVTARTRDAGGGSAVPVVAATAGLRLGQSQAFSGLDDALSLRTGYGFAETGGGAAKIRARIIIGGASNLVSIVTERTFTLAAREQVFLPELVRSFAGEARDTLFGDLHGLVLEVEVIEGFGAVVPFVLATDVGTQDVSVVVQ